jgi:hypothetical protein
VLAAIKFDYETCGMANEIHDVWTNWGLATKARALHAIAAQGRPHQAFDIG